MGRLIQKAIGDLIVELIEVGKHVVLSRRRRRWSTWEDPAAIAKRRDQAYKAIVHDTTDEERRALLEHLRKLRGGRL